MIIQLNETDLVNTDNIFTAKRLTKIPIGNGDGSTKDSFRIWISSIHGSSDTFYFDNEVDLNKAWIKLRGNI